MNPPANLPPLPPVPPGFDHWEYRGTHWNASGVKYALGWPGWLDWSVMPSAVHPSGSGCHYIEAVREPAKEPIATLPATPDDAPAVSIEHKPEPAWHLQEFEPAAGEACVESVLRKFMAATGTSDEGLTNMATIEGRVKFYERIRAVRQEAHRVLAQRDETTGVEARVCEDGWRQRVERVACMCRDDVAAAIAGCSPWDTKDSDVCAADDVAMTLIHLRHDKREIVNLIRWCLMGCPPPPAERSDHE